MPLCPTLSASTLRRHFGYYGHVCLFVCLFVLVCAALAWSPVESCVAIACGAAGVSLWTPAGCGVFRLQASMRAATLQWNADGRRLLVAGRRSACLCQLAAADSRAAAVTVQLYAKAP